MPHAKLTFRAQEAVEKTQNQAEKTRVYVAEWRLSRCSTLSSNANENHFGEEDLRARFGFTERSFEPIDRLQSIMGS